MYIVFDTETTGLPRDYNAPVTDSENWPRCVQLAWQIHDKWGELIEVKNYIIKPDGFTIPYNSEKIHGISTERAMRQGVELEWVLKEFNEALEKADFVVGQNIGFDINVMGAEFHRIDVETPMMNMESLDTCTEKTANLCQIPGGRGGKFKLPTLTELHEHLFGEAFNEAHNASADVEATARCFLELVRIENFTEHELHADPGYLTEFKEKNPKPFELIGLNIEPYTPDHEEFEDVETQSEPDLTKEEIEDNLKELEEVAFSHLHNHTQFSVLQATTKLDAMIEKASKDGMPAIAMTDMGNLMGAYLFTQTAINYNNSLKAKKEEGQEIDAVEVKPIVGCVFNVCKDHNDKSKKDNGNQAVLIAKNKKGYHNLAKMSSIAHTEGFYYVPRIDREVVEKYKEDVICLTGNLSGEVPNLVLNVGEKQAEESLLWWKEQFGEDLYIELMRHGQEDEDRVNKVLLDFAKKHDVEVVATNSTYYLDKSDANAHDILLCVKDGERQSTPIGRGRGYRYGLPNQEYYIKPQDEMKELFKDLPDAISNTQKIVDKCTAFSLARDVLLPKYEIPEEFKDPKDEEDGGNRGENNYLRHITYEGAKKRYDEITDEIRERLDFELETIERTGYPGYFLIVQDFTTAAREMGVSVGPGRGSAAGSAVAYCIGITNVDPIAYDLLFERFLNPDRVSMPDIDIDFDDEGRQKVIDYVIDKYGANQVAQIITYGTMAAKSAIRDTGRVLELPLPDTDQLAKTMPDLKLHKLFGMEEKDLKEKLKNNGDEIAKAERIKEISGEEETLEGKTINQARILEGSLRNTGIHACGVIITPGDITDYVPVAKAKDSDMWCTQFDNSVVEDAGLLKMDFLGLKTLTLIKDAVSIVKERHDIDLNPEQFPLDDEKTYELFQRGETVGIFQYESRGMQKYMRDLKPTTFADLIAMNALYRPGPLEYIPSFIKRKHGQEEIKYDLPDMQEYLEETYGITVYQEQVMLLSQKLAGFTKGEADTLRKAMGKKKFDLLAKLKPQFLNQGEERGHDKETLEKIWKDWEAFASYAFNKSHSTCYAWVAYQTAYLKAHYPAEYMASVLSNNMNDISQVTFFMEECRRMGVKVLGPDVNESKLKFTVNERGEVRFGLGALKGVGDGAVRAIVEEREEEGAYQSIFDFAKRVNLKACNKKAFESLALGGAFDSFPGVHRAQYFAEDNGRYFLENVIRFGNNFQESKNSSQVSLFGEASEVDIPEPQVPEAEEWNTLAKLRREKEIVGVYISGHPLDDYNLEIKHFCTYELSALNKIEEYVNKEMRVAGIVTDVKHLTTGRGKPFGKFMVEDYSESFEFVLFGDDYLKFKPMLEKDYFLFIKGKVEKWRRKNEDTDNFSFRIAQMELLSELREKLAQTLNINMELGSITEQTVDDLDRVLTENKGNCKVIVNVYDRDEKIKLNLMSRTLRVNISNELIEELERWDHVHYKLN
ncbi:DNA polymerase III subunit alpha [Salibacter halophilus]|uniref:DNA polymerase III subunit alpha n=1 Tax=Salibacter halophilus TaxID=1803916 RepID=A0A6N6M9Q1_9FLAO|nr:DNA polymerase III subunit alpha [Salibacter halophilus]KAB1065249.1 DNA polymerase III subunit alpha [Salibacter halophilus]